MSSFKINPSDKCVSTHLGVEQVPLLEEGGIEAFIRREVLPYTPDAWIKEGTTKIGYEISFTRHSSATLFAIPSLPSSVIFELKLPGVKRSQFNHETPLFHQIGWRR
jgi:hypothetical protein